MMLPTVDDVLALSPELPDVAALGNSLAGVCVFAVSNASGIPNVEVRSFAPAMGVPEDPSGNGCVAALIRQIGILRTHSHGCCIYLSHRQNTAR